MSGALAGHVALITGAAQGIGRAIAEELVCEGARVVLADPGTGIDGLGADPRLVHAAAAALGEAALPFPDSIASPSAAHAAVGLALTRFGGLDIVVNNAAILRDAFIFKLDPGDFEAVIRTDLTAAAFVTAAACPILREQAKSGRGAAPGGAYGWGRIVNIISTAGLYGNYGQAAYAAAKAGLVGLMRVTALDMARSGVTANAVAPFAATRVTRSIKPANEAQALYRERAMKVPAAPVARFVAYLATPAAHGVSGQVFGVRGREVFLFSQSRPIARAQSAEATTEAIAALVEREFAPQFTPLSTDLEAFSTEPIV
ncbi:MAG: SDR family NAD(P)-dependent oxidoreductase [Pseudomonadota bacterium]